jgi:phospholipid/cholesterol/gamma-HCH transport system substrate-binding protein
MVELMVSPIGLGNQFLFHAGLGLEQIAEGDLVPAVNSLEGRAALQSGLAVVPSHDDSISLILNRLSTTLETANIALLESAEVLAQVQGAFQGDETTAIGRTMGGVERSVEGLESMTRSIPVTVDDSITAVLAQIQPILTNLDELSAKLNDPAGSVSSVLDGKGAVYTNLVSSLEAVTGTLRNLEKTSAFLPAQAPQLAVLISDLRSTVKSAEDVLIALSNNPLLRDGIPERVETRTGGTSPRDISF